MDRESTAYIHSEVSFSRKQGCSYVDKKDNKHVGRTSLDIYSLSMSHHALSVSIHSTCQYPYIINFICIVDAKTIVLILEGIRDSSFLSQFECI